MIRRSFRFGVRLGLLAGIALALFKFVQGRRSASEFGSPSADWAPAPPPPSVPKPPPEPELIQPTILEEIVAKKAAERAGAQEHAPAPAGSATRAEQSPASAPGVEDPRQPVVKKVTPAKRAAAKEAAASSAPATAGPVKKTAPKKSAAKKRAAKKAPADKTAADTTAAQKAPARKAPAKKAPAKKAKAAPAKKAAKKRQP